MVQVAMSQQHRFNAYAQFVDCCRNLVDISTRIHDNGGSRYGVVND
jgi:hypothetical protein